MQQYTTELDNLLSVKDIMKKLNVGHNTAYKLVALKGCPKIKIGRTYKIPEKEFDKWLRAHMYSEIQL